ncbi:MAG: glycosyltransferase family 4 protein [Chloroflexi bacterium]|nr:glycosyltransferase family 4 protein [Chloroflexota bacterium]
MRILITTDIFPPDVGGPATYVPLIAAQLTARGHEVHVLTYSQDHSVPGDMDYPFRIQRVVIRGSRPARFWRVARLIAQWGREADVWYVNGMGLEARLADPLRRVPVVAKVVGDIAWERAFLRGWVHDDIEMFQCCRYPPWVELLKWRRNAMYDGVQRVIAPSKYLARIVAGWGVMASRIEVIHNAFAPLATLPKPKAIALGADRIIVTACRLVPWKGVDGILEALAGLSNVGLVVIGEGPMRAEWEAMAKALDLSRRVLFTGAIRREELYQYMAAADVFVLNSRYEGLPHIVLEAAAAGLPVVAADAGGTGEVVMDGVSGLLVPPGDTLSLQATLMRLLSDESLRRRLVEGARAQLANFSLAQMVERTETVLSEAVSQR